MHVSSIGYSACLPANRALRLFVLLSGLCFTITGAVLILAMPLALLPRLAVAGVWLLASGYDIERQRRAYRQYSGLRLDCEGRVEIRNRQGEWLGARLLPGSLVLRRFGWIRIRDERGRVFAEPVCGQCRDSCDWRRLQVLWRHVGAYS